MRLINAYISDEKLNQEVLLVHSINTAGCKNYGMSADLVDKYLWRDIDRLWYTDTDLKCITREGDRSEEGTCHIHTPPLYHKGLKMLFLK